MWTADKIRPIVTMTGSHQRTCVFGALCIDGRQFFRQYSVFNQETFLKYLKELRRKFGKIILFIDRARQHHRSIMVRRYIKQSKGVMKVRRSPTRHDNIDFRPIITKISSIIPLSVVTADKGYDSEESHVLVRDLLHGLSIIPTRYEHVPIWKTHGIYRKQMKRGYSKLIVQSKEQE
jgi:hypothetical protein